MTRDDIIRMAREAGATPYTNRHYPDRPTHTFNPEQLGRFAALITEAATEEANARQNASWALMCKKMVAAEREAMVAEAAKRGWAMKNEDSFEDAVREIANDRARSNP
jgi:hypothetical protein